MSKEHQPDALRLADELLEPIHGFPKPSMLESDAAAELRRLHAESEALKRELIKEAARTAAEKRRADHMNLQHSMQAALNREAREQLARYAEAEIAEKAKNGGCA